MAHATRPAGRYAAWAVEHAQRAVPGPEMVLADDVINFGGGQPAAELYPLEALQRAFSRTLLEDGRRILPYGSIEGLPALRSLVAERLARRGIQTTADEVIITSGSMQGLHLVGRVMLDHGDAVVTEAPTFSAALGTWEHQQPVFVSIPVDEHGMRVDDLEDMLRANTARKPKFVYLLPTFQNPSGVSMTLARRRRLLELADEFDLLILEDDPYGEFWYDAGTEPTPPLRSLPGGEQRVVYLGTFSKILAPGLRLAYAVAHPALRRLLIRAKRGLDYQTDGVVQQSVVRLVRDGDFDLEDHIARGRAVYRERRDAMLDALETTFTVETRWTRPSGGYFLWLDLPAGVSGEAASRAAARLGVEVWPGAMFYPNHDGGQNSLRLSFADSPPDRIREGIRRLYQAVQSVAE
jgi:2-aminoadipate transaminase